MFVTQKKPRGFLIIIDRTKNSNVTVKKDFRAFRLCSEKHVFAACALKEFASFIFDQSSTSVLILIRCSY